MEVAIRADSHGCSAGRGRGVIALAVGIKVSYGWVIYRSDENMRGISRSFVRARAAGTLATTCCELPTGVRFSRPNRGEKKNAIACWETVGKIETDRVRPKRRLSRTFDSILVNFILVLSH